MKYIYNGKQWEDENGNESCELINLQLPKGFMVGPFTGHGLDKGDYICFNSAKMLHNEYGPAIYISPDFREWYIDGKLHREDGPAVEWGSGLNMWYINGKQIE